MTSTSERGNQINWNQVFLFSEIAAAGSLKGAAVKLGLSASTLSEHLSQLESDLQVQLFQRQHRKLTLTEQGARLYRHAKTMFESGKRFIDAISPVPLGCYPVSIGVVAGACYGSAYRLIGDYSLRYPEVPLRIFHYRQEELEQALLDGELDFGFTDRRIEHRHLRQATLVSSELRFFAAEHLAGHDLADLLKRLPLLLAKANALVSSAVEQALDALDIVPVSIIVSEFPSLIEELCRRGAGVACMGKEHFGADAGLQTLRLPRDFPIFSENIYVTWPPEAEASEAILHLMPLVFSGG